MSFTHARGPEEHYVLSAFDEGEARKLHDLLARCAGGEVEVVLIERLDRGEASDARAVGEVAASIASGGRG